MIPTALSIAGSDPSGGAGIQADLKTFSALKVYGMAVISAITMQNTQGVSGVLEIPPDAISRQIDAVVTDIVPGAVKTGMLSTAEAIDTVADRIRKYRLAKLVVDPVMVSTSGTRLIQPDAVEALRRTLLPLALVVTPNLHEAGVLSGREVRTVEDMEAGALDIHSLGAQHVYIKGGHLEGDAVDVLFDGRDFTRYVGSRIASKDSHGTGCVLSSAIAGYLARGESVADAVRLSKDFVTAAIRNGLRLGSGRGPCDPLGITG